MRRKRRQKPTKVLKIIGRFERVVCFLFLAGGSLISLVYAQRSTQGETVLFQQGRVEELTVLSLYLRVPSSTGGTLEHFAIATNANVIEPPPFKKGDEVNVSYVKHGVQRILVCLQHEVEIDPERPSSHLAVSELVVSGPESSRILSKVGAIEPRLPGWRAGGGSELSGFRGLNGTVVRAHRLSPFETELVVRPDPGTSEVTFVIDLLTKVTSMSNTCAGSAPILAPDGYGRLREGVKVSVSSESEKGREYATEVSVDLTHRCDSHPPPR